MKLIVEESVKDLFLTKENKTKNIFNFNSSKLGAELNNGVIFACDLNEKDLSVTINLLTKQGENNYQSYYEKTIKLDESFEYNDSSTDCDIKTKFTLIK